MRSAADAVRCPLSSADSLSKGEVIHPAVKDLKVKVTLAPNPSHLEAINPVVNGTVRALQVRALWGDEGDRGRKDSQP